MGFQRPESGFRFNFGGIKTNAAADELPPEKYPYAKNVRYVKSLQTRPGYSQNFLAGSGITDIGTYSTLETDNQPHILARDTSNRIYVDSGQVGQLSGSSLGACMIPYRPNASPQSWMYVAGAEDYKKYSAPDIVTGAVIESEVGIEEPHDAPGACTNDFEYTNYFGAAAVWTQGGTAAASSDTARINEVVGVVLADPDQQGTVDLKASVNVPQLDGYQVGMPIHFSTGKDTAILELLPALAGGLILSVQSIFYFSGTTGHCIIVPQQSPVSSAFQGAAPLPSPYLTSPLSALSRGSIINLSGGAGSESLFVLNSVIGPQGTICFEMTTTLAFVAGDSITGLPAISCQGIDPTDTGATVTCPDITWAQTGAGTGTQSLTLASSPFNVISSDGTAITQQFDYVGFAINVSDLTKLVSVTFIFNINPTKDYVTDGFYYQLTADQLAAHPGPQTQIDAAIAVLEQQLNAGLITVQQFNQRRGQIVTTPAELPTAQYTTILIPITSLIRFGGNVGFSLSDTNGIQIKVETSGSVTVRSGPFTVGIGDQPDIGPSGSPYMYRVRTRSSLTGAVSNPSPETRFGVIARRQSVHISMTDTVGDPQADTWDIFRVGGAINSMRYIGSVPNTGGLDTFTDNVFDTATLGTSVLEFDNFEPWPTIDVPFTATKGGFSGITVDITVCGTAVLLTYYSASPFTDPAPATILRWLPGTLILLDGANAFTLWNRPTAFTLSSPPAAHYYSYLFRIVENAGTLTPNVLLVQEPLVANQHLPYLWGSDANGTVFGCGDPFRPGNVYFCKSFTPDSAPDNYNQEITNPSEPLLGGEIINGLALVASSKRWWALYPNFGSGNRYQAVEAPVTRGMIAPYAHATDGRLVYFWAKDGIWTTTGNSLTDMDLHNLFPHEGVIGRDYVYGGKTIYAPDYKYAAEFRLCYANAYLYADYRDSNGVPRTLICDLRDPSRPAWSVDEYADPIIVHYALPQQSGTLLTTAARYDTVLMGDNNGKGYAQSDLLNDNSAPISGAVATFEFNGGDVRSNELYNDQFLDLVPAAIAGVNATILEGGSSVQPVFNIPSSSARQHTNVPIGLELSYMGVLLEWTDDFRSQNLPTLLRSWQPMFQSVPISLTKWSSQGTTFGISGYKCIPEILFAYKSTAPVTLTITVYDGTAPAPIVLPSTGGAYQKTLFRPTANKGMIYFFSAECDDAEWQPYLSDTEIHVCAWERSEPCQIARDIPTAVGVGDR